jgi:phospholipase D1/2
MSEGQDNLAYGADYSGNRSAGSQGADRGLVGGTLKFLKNKYEQSQGSPHSQPSYGYTENPQGSNEQQYTPDQGSHVSCPSPRSEPTCSSEIDGSKQISGPGSQPPYPGGPPPQPQQPKPDTVTSIFNTIHGVAHNVGSELAGRLSSQYNTQSSTQQQPQSGQPGPQSGQTASGGSTNRYSSFVSQKDGNDVKWYVDGCSYMYAVSRALESARESIWILDCESVIPPPSIWRLTS